MSSPFSSIDNFPVKLFKDTELLKSIIHDKKVLPRSIHLNVTNRCNFGCKMCICSERDKKKELSLYDVRYFLNYFKEQGTKTIILTGGGEPLLHKDINLIIHYIRSMGMDVGLVTNGVYLDKLSNVQINELTWIRVSSTDDLNNQVNLDNWFNVLKSNVKRGIKVDWGFGHVLTSNPDYYLIRRLTKFAKENNFTHIRISKEKGVYLIFGTPNMKEMLEEHGIYDSLIVYEGNNYERGMNPCYVSHLKTVVNADGKLYPCCNISFAQNNPDKDFKKSFMLPEYFDGSQCDRCYLYKYNEVIDMLIKDTVHEAFI